MILDIPKTENKLLIIPSCTITVLFALDVNSVKASISSENLVQKYLQ